MNEQRINDPAEDICEDCGHKIRHHGPEGCEMELGDTWVDGEAIGAWMARGPCGCQATTLEPIEEVEDRPVAWPSPLVAKRKPLDVPFDELEATT